jgi:hypothetical protein
MSRLWDGLWDEHCLEMAGVSSTCSSGLSILRLTPSHGHLILGITPEEGARVGAPVEVPAGVPA